MRTLRTVKRRDVVFICGYEIAPPEVHHRRMQRDLPLFEKTWNAQARISPPTIDRNRNISRWHVQAKGPNWQVEADYRIFWWGDVIAPDFEQPNWRRLLVGFAAFFDFAFSGALLAYFRANWRYALFFLFPYVLLAAVGVGSYALARALMTGPWPWTDLLAALIGIGAVFVVLKLPPRPLYVGYLLNDWTFARDLVRRRRSVLEQRIDGFARALAELDRNTSADEIVLVGHSLGAVHIVDVVARAKRLDRSFGRRKAEVAVLTIGSSLLKIGLHPAAASLRKAVQELSVDRRIFWIEYQALIDIVNFYKSNPVTDMGLPPAPNPRVQIARIRHMLEEATYKDLHGDFFRVHRQFVMGNERRYFYDYYMICFGPIPLRLRGAYPQASVAAFAPDGSYRPAALKPSKKQRVARRAKRNSATGLSARRKRGRR